MNIELPVKVKKIGKKFKSNLPFFMRKNSKFDGPSKKEANKVLEIKKPNILHQTITAKPTCSQIPEINNKQYQSSQETQNSFKKNKKITAATEQTNMQIEHSRMDMNWAKADELMINLTGDTGERDTVTDRKIIDNSFHDKNKMSEEETKERSCVDTYVDPIMKNEANNLTSQSYTETLPERENIGVVTFPSEKRIEHERTEDLKDMCLTPRVTNKRPSLEEIGNESIELNSSSNVQIHPSLFTIIGGFLANIPFVSCQEPSNFTIDDTERMDNMHITDKDNKLSRKKEVLNKETHSARNNQEEIETNTNTAFSNTKGTPVEESLRNLKTIPQGEQGNNGLSWSEKYDQNFCYTFNDCIRDVNGEFSFDEESVDDSRNDSGSIRDSRGEFSFDESIDDSRRDSRNTNSIYSEESDWIDDKMEYIAFDNDHEEFALVRPKRLRNEAKICQQETLGQHSEEKVIDIVYREDLKHYPISQKNLALLKELENVIQTLKFDQIVFQKSHPTSANNKNQSPFDSIKFEFYKDAAD